MLKIIDTKLDVIRDVNMYQYIKKYKRGGVSIITQSYSNSNNKKWNQIIITSFLDTSYTMMPKNCMIGQWQNIFHFLNLSF